MSNAAELEAYMDKMEDRYFALHPDPVSGHRRNWDGYRRYIARVKEGLVPDVTPETATREAADHLLGLRRVFGEEIHPRHAIRKRQVMALAALANPSHAEPPGHPARSSIEDRVEPCGSTPPP
jgi:hypothetical protein